MASDDEIIRLPIGLDFTAAQADIAEEQARLATAFQKVPGLEGRDFSFIRRVVNTPDFGDLASFRGQYPQVGRALDRYNRFASTGKTDEQRAASARDEAKQRQQELTAKRADAQQAARDQAKQRADAKQADRDAAKQRVQAAAAKRAADRQASQAEATERKTELAALRADAKQAAALRRQRQQDERNELNLRRARGRSLSALGAFAAGAGTGQLRASLAEVAYTLAAGGSLGETSVGGIFRQHRSTLAQAVGNATGSAVAGGVGADLATSATADAASSPEAAAAGSAVGSGIQGVMGAAFWPALAVAAVAGVVNAGSAIEASVWTSRYQLANAITGSTGQKLYGDILSVASATIRDPSLVAGVATQLGGMGVKGADVVPNTETALDLTRIEPAIPQATANQLVGTLSAQGGQSAQDIGTTLDTLRLTSDTTGLSLEKMTTNLLEFEKATNGAALNMKSLADLLTTQAQLGPGGNAFTALAPGVNAQGARAVMLAGVLGISEQQLGQEQQSNQGLLQAQIGAYLRKQTSGLSGRGQVDRAEIIGQQLGMIDTSAMNPTKAAAYVQALLYPDAGLHARITKAAAGAGYGDFRGASRTAANLQTSLADKIKNAAQIAALQGANQGVGPAPSAALQAAAQIGMVPLSVPNVLGQTIQGAHERLGLLGDVAGAVGSTVGSTFGAHPFNAQTLFGGKSGNVTETLTTIRDTDKALYDWLQRHEDLFSFTAAQKAILNGTSTTTSQAGSGATVGSGKHPGASAPLPSGGLTGGGGPTWTGGSLGAGSYALAASGRPGEAPLKVSGALLADYVRAAGGNNSLLKMMLVQGARESGFNPNATAPDGGQGIAQFMPGTIASLNARKDSPFYGKSFSPYDPAQATMLQAYYDKLLLSQEGGNVQAAFRDYNGSGPAAARYGQQAYGAYQNVSVHVVVEDKTTGGVKAHATVNHDRTPPGYTGTNPPPFITHGGRR